MFCSRNASVLSSLLGLALAFPGPAAAQLPLHAGRFKQQIQVPYGTEEGLSSGVIKRLALGPDGRIYALTGADTVFRLDGESWSSEDNSLVLEDLFPHSLSYTGLESVGVDPSSVRDAARHRNETAVAAKDGLYLSDGEGWTPALPQNGHTRWAPLDVRAVEYDAQGCLWFAAPQGAGRRIRKNEWQLFSGSNGLPFNDFTCMASGLSGVWFGTTNGAIQFHEGRWLFRQGRRWLVNNHVNDIVIDTTGDAWIATNNGVSLIRHLSMTLAEKALFYEDEIEKYHRRTKFGYVNPATLAAPGDRTTATPIYSDNDGFNTGLYLGAMSFAYAATGKDKYRNHAHEAFHALAFLSEVTQGGPYGGPEGLIARNVVPATEPDPGDKYDKDYDISRNQQDSLWKIMGRRVPIDKTGEWYWKTDASSDELDGHFFGYAIYFDRACESEEEKNAVGVVVRRIIDHLIEHDFALTDYDGKPTRWARFSPDDMNRDPAWHAERGLNCYSILTYLAIAHHILGDSKYRQEYLKLAYDHGYGMNGMTHPKEVSGPDDPGHQPDDNMAFMNYYHLIRYETDPKLLSMYQYAIRKHWQYERLERNAFTNFVYGACAKGKERSDQWGTSDLSPPFACYEDAVETLKRYPLDLIEWPMSNAHRIDMVPLDHPGDGPPTLGSDIRGYTFPIDERQEIYWDWNCWKLSYGGDGTTLRPPHHYLLAYYMGCIHVFVTD